MQHGLAVTVIVALIALGVCGTGDLAAASDANASAKRGRQTFARAGCYMCHGYEAQGGSYFGPRLGPEPVPLEVVSAFVRGKAGTGNMPAYGEKVLPNSDLADIYAFLKSLPRPKSPDSILELNGLQ